MEACSFEIVPEAEAPHACDVRETIVRAGLRCTPEAFVSACFRLGIEAGRCGGRFVFYSDDEARDLARITAAVGPARRQRTGARAALCIAAALLLAAIAGVCLRLAAAKLIGAITASAPAHSEAYIVCTDVRN